MEHNEIDINYVKQELKSIRKNLSMLKSWEKEIEVIENKLNAYNANELGFKSGKTFDLSDIVANDKARIEILNSKIVHTNFKISRMKKVMVLTDLDYDENKVIELKYLDEDIRTISFEAIGGILNCSKVSIKRLHDRAIKKIVPVMNKEINKNETKCNEMKQVGTLCNK